MEPIRLGLLLPGGRPVGEGIRNAQRAPVMTARGETIAIVKDLPLSELAIELFCALLGRELNLPVPEPLLVVNPAGSALMSGSVDMGYPSLHQPALAPHLALLAALLQQWPSLIPAACFDEWIANPDRHGGNLLFDGRDFWLIDHGLALRCAPGDPVKNRLMAIAIEIRTDELARQRLKREIFMLYQTYTEGLITAVKDAMNAAKVLQDAGNEIEHCQWFLQQRLLSLSNMTALRIRTAQDDLYGC